MPMAAPFTTVSQGSSRKRVHRVIKTQFGDGYAQIRPDGTNNLVDEWTIVLDLIYGTTRTTLLTFFNTIGSWDYFTWTPPGGVSQKWKIEEGYQEAPQSGDIYQYSFKCIQYFGA